MLNVSLDQEAEQYLVEILSQEKTTSSELIKKLLRDYRQNFQSQKSVLERMGGMPKHLLSVGNLSDRDTRRAKGTGNREQGTGNREQGVGSRKQGTGDRGQKLSQLI